MVSVTPPERFGNAWQVNIQSDTPPGTMPQSGADVVNIPDDYLFFAGSSLTVLEPFGYYKYGEDGQWHEVK